MTRSKVGRYDAHVELPVPEIREIKAKLPAVWQGVASKARARDPDDRYPTCGDFARDVREVVSGKWYLRNL